MRVKVRISSDADPTTRVSREIARWLFGPPAARDFPVRYPNGSVEDPPGEARFALVLRRPGALRRMLLPPTQVALGEAYLRDDFDVEGDLEAATGLADAIATRLRSPAASLRLIRLLRALPADDMPADGNGAGRPASRLRGRRHSRGRDAAAVRFHYDAGNGFYALWLDRLMVYSCAYFSTRAENIDAAQVAKLDLICRKLRLKPGERLLDIGCGWGALVQYAAENYGVRALGITLSESQAELARERIAEAGLTGRCRVEVRDYRNLPRGASFDKVVSVGMFEHVGRAKLPTYFAEAYRHLRPGGLFLNHGIVSLAPPSGTTRLARSALGGQTSFVQRYVFPDGELVTPGETLGFAEAAGFETRDVESLREHYALTLRRWVRRLEDHHDEARRLAGEQTYRTWRLYMAASARAFATGRIGIVQALFSRSDGGLCELPLTRADLYAKGGAP